jgi:D-alanine-D-alanine ligase
MDKKVRVAILMGGPSAEHDISLSSGKNVAEILDKEKHEVIPVFVTRGLEWSVNPEKLKDKADIAFLTFHGDYNKDGIVQEKLRDLDIPYTGSDVLQSALARNKVLTNRLLEASGFNIPRFIVAHQHEKEFSLENLEFPLIVKPINKGSSVGISIVRKPDEVYEAVQRAFGFSRDVIIQEFVHGKEVTCAVVEDDVGGLIPLPVVEIMPVSKGYLDYHSKYTPGAVRQLVPAKISKRGQDLIQETAVRAHKTIDASGISRTDMIIGEDDKLYVLEVNTMPDMTPTSSVLQAAYAHGLTPSEAIERIIEAGMRKNRAFPRAS